MTKRHLGWPSSGLLIIALSLVQGDAGTAQQMSVLPALGEIEAATADSVDQHEFVLDAKPDRVQAIATRHGLTIVRALNARGNKNVYLVRASGIVPVDTLVTQVAADADVAHFELNGIAITPEVPAGIHLNLDQSPVSILDTNGVNYFGQLAWTRYVMQPAADAIRVRSAHDTYATGAEIVAIIDTGVDPNHALLKNSLVPGYDFLTDTPGGSEWGDLDPTTAAALNQDQSPVSILDQDQSPVSILDMDQSPVSILDNATVVPINQSTVAFADPALAQTVSSVVLPPAFGHGTMVAGLVHLVAPTAKIMPLKAFKADGSSRVFDIVRAIYYAVENGARVINMSFSTAELSPEITHAIDYATENGVICVSSAGNSGRQLLVYPAALRNVVGIGSTSSTTPATRSTFTNYGNSLVRLGAPGEAVITTYPGGRYVAAWGTSFSTGLASGAAALLLQRNPSLDPADASDLLGKADKMPSAHMGRGRLNLEEALEKLPDEVSPSVSFVTPGGGGVVWNTVSVSVSASDNVKVAGVQFFVDNQRLGAEDTSAPFEAAWSTAGVPNGGHTLMAVARDSSGNKTATSLSVTVLNDLAAPTVQMTSPAPGTKLSGVVTLAASAADDIEVVGVQFQVDGAAVGPEAGGAPFQTAWSTSSVANGTHTVTAVARDASGKQTTAASITITVENDTGAPAVTVTGPVANATVHGTITLAATATDDVAVAGVRFLVNGVGAGAEDTEAPYELAWNTATIGNGTHTVTAVARDGAGRETTAAGVAVIVANDVVAPVVTVTTPAIGASVSGGVTLSASATDEGGVAGVQFLLDGAPLGAEDLVAPYETAWLTTTAVNGAHTLTAIARDAAGNLTTAEMVTVTVANDLTAPTIVLMNPAAGADLSGSVVVTANATDEGQIAGVRFLLDGVAVGAEDFQPPYELTWSTTTVANGSHTLTAIARDAAGNEATAAALTVTVANDTTPPSVALASPAGGATVSDVVTLTASATDEGSVASVQFLLDGAALGATDTAAPYELVWSTLTVSNGAHALTAIARDAAGNEATAAAVTVTVSNDTTAPTVAVTSPAGGATVSDVVTLTASATDEGSVASVQFLLDGAALGATDTVAPYELAWSTVDVSNGAHVLTAMARDTAGNEATAAAVTVTVSNDTTAPTVAVISPAGGVTLNGSVTVIASAADERGIAGVQFLLDGAPLGAADIAAPFELSWSTLTVPNGAHVLTAIARDAAGNESTAAAVSVTVANDTQAPTVAVTSPAGGTTVSGNVTLTATATDEGGVASVLFLLDGAAFGATDTAAPYQLTWSTLTVPNGAHVLTAIARDEAGNEATAAAVTVTVSNDTTAPAVAVSAPGTGATVSGTVTLTATAADDGGVTGVQFLLDGAALGATDAAAPYELAWSTLTVPNGAHVLTAIARDAAGNEATAAAVTVTVSNDTTAPTVAVTGPAADATVSGSVTLTAMAADENGVASVQFLLDGTALGATDAAAPYEVAWSTLTVPNGAHVLTAIAFDAAGNQATAAAITVTVANDPPVGEP